MKAEHTTIAAYVMSLMNQGMDRVRIEAVLHAKGHDDQFVRDVIAETARLRDARRRSQALILILVGAVICFLSFLLTITGSFSDSSFPYVLFGLTGLGIVIALAGFARIF